MATEEYFCIKLSFLSPKNYKFLQQNSLKLNKGYQDYRDSIQHYYQCMRQFCTNKQNETKQKIQFLHLFRQFFRQKTKIIQKMSSYQLSCFQMNKQKQQDLLSQPFLQIIDRCKQLSPVQYEIRTKKQEITNQFTSLKKQYVELVTKAKKPKYYYDLSLMKQQCKVLQTKAKQNLKKQQQIMKDLQIVNKNTQNFYALLDYLRKRLLKNKYTIHKNFITLAINSRQSLMELFFYLFNCFNQYNKLIHKSMEQQNQQIALLKSTRKLKNWAQDQNCEAKIIKHTDQYITLIDEIQNILTFAQQNFNKMAEKIGQIQSKRKSLQNINKFFEVDQSPSTIILDTLNFYEYFLRKFTQKSFDCNKAAKSLQKIKKDVIKHKGITISLLKVRSRQPKVQHLFSESQKLIVSQTKMQQNHSCQVQDFMNSLNLIQVKSVVKNFMNSLQQTFVQIKTYFNSKIQPKRKLLTNDSMELSYIQTNILKVQKKRPVKQELWLWQTYKKKINTEFALSADLSNQMNQFLTNFNNQPEINLQLQKYPCFFTNRKGQQQGILCISKKSVKFISSQSNRELIIPVKDIEQVKLISKFIVKDFIVLKTKIGVMQFSKFQNITQVEQVLKDLLQSGGGITPGNIKKRQKIQLSEEQLKKIQQRKQQVKKSTVSITDFTLLDQRIFQKIGIDEFYDLILSDKKYTLTGKQHQCFLAYAMKKLKNKNFKVTSYSPSGPKYYTLNEDVTFLNCPISSECEFDFRHQLPSIPFMPSECGNHDRRKIFWISHQELQYFVFAQTSGVPLSQCFHVELVYNITKQEQNVKLMAYGKIVFTKSTSLKSMVENSSWPQIKQGTKKTLDQMQKSIKLYKAISSGQKVEQAVEEQLQTKPQEDQINRLKKRNKIMLYVIAGIIILNIIYKIFL